MKFLMGLILGIVLAAGVVFYINNQTSISQFLPAQHSNASDTVSDNNSATPIVLAPGTKNMQQASDAIVANSSNTIQNTPESKENQNTNYEFYDILEGKTKFNESNSPKTVAPVVKSDNRIYLQVGAYSTSDDANNMKARLILMDIEAQIINTTVNNKLINKVIVGPFKTSEEAHTIQSQLQEQGISAIISNNINTKGVN